MSEKLTFRNEDPILGMNLPTSISHGSVSENYSDLSKNPQVQNWINKTLGVFLGALATAQIWHISGIGFSLQSDLHGSACSFESYIYRTGG